MEDFSYWHVIRWFVVAVAFLAVVVWKYLNRDNKADENDISNAQYKHDH